MQANLSHQLAGLLTSKCLLAHANVFHETAVYNPDSQLSVMQRTLTYLPLQQTAE